MYASAIAEQFASQSTGVFQAALKNQVLFDSVRELAFRGAPLAERTLRDLRMAVFEGQRLFDSVTQETFANLNSRIGMMDTAWLLPELPSASLTGFARLSLLRDSVHTAEPYDETLGEVVADELGTGIEADVDDEPLARDMSAIQAGLPPELIAFQPSNYHQVIQIAGFSIIRAPTPQAVESTEADATFDLEYGMLITQVEQRLRTCVETRLLGIAGPKWIKQQVPPEMRERWEQRQDEERKAGRPVFSLVQYSDFMDLLDVIARSDNWRDVFEPVFRHADDFRESMRRLHPIRQAVAHSRPIGRADVLTLCSEAVRILRALDAAL